MKNKDLSPQVETRFEFKNEEDKPAELYLYGTIRQAQWYESEDDVISSKRVRSALNNMKGKSVDVHINSGGGDVFESIAIRNLFLQHDGDINIYIDSMAGSGASIIATAGKNIYMFDNSMQMIHKAWTIAVGNSDELKKVAADLDKIDEAVKSSYMTKFVGSADELEALIADETYLTAEECVAFGFATSIISLQADEEETLNKTSLFNKYKMNVSVDINKPIQVNEPSSLLNKFRKAE